MSLTEEEYVSYIKKNYDDILFEKMGITTEKQKNFLLQPRIISDTRVHEYTIYELIQKLTVSKGYWFGELALMSK